MTKQSVIFDALDTQQWRSPQKIAVLVDQDPFKVRAILFRLFYRDHVDRQYTTTGIAMYRRKPAGRGADHT